MSDARRIARVCVASPLPHLDRLFDYSIPEDLVPRALPGTRVRVRFAGRLVDAVIADLAVDSAFEGDVAPLLRCAARPSYAPQILSLSRAVADRYGGSFWDVLRLAAPPRHAGAEAREPRPGREGVLYDGDDAPAAGDAGAAGLADAIALAASGARGVWSATPDPSHRIPADDLVAIALAGAGAASSAVVVVPDARAVDAVVEAARRRGLARWTSRGGGDVAVIHTEIGPAARYGAHLAALSGEARLVVGTRPAVFASVPRLGAVVTWDDGNTAYDERHAPYPHMLAVAAMRAEAEGAALVAGGYAVSVAAQALVEHRWAQTCEPSREQVRERTPAVTVGASDRGRDPSAGHWMPGDAWSLLRGGLGAGPGLVLVPRAGYVRATACAACRAWAVCRDCGDPLELRSAGGDPVCVSARHPNPQWHCPECGGGRLASVRLGVEKVAEDMRAMLPGHPTHLASAEHRLDDGEARQGIVVATPAAAPAVPGGYACAVIVDASALVGTGLDGEADAVRLLLNTIALVRPRAGGGAVRVVGELPAATARAVSTWSPRAFAVEQYVERAALGLPPDRRTVGVWGDPALVASVAELARDLGDAARVARLEAGYATFLVTRGAAQRLVASARALQVAASRDGAGELRIRVDGPVT